MKATMETINRILIYSSVNRRTQAQADVMMWINKSIKHTIITCTNSWERITEVKLINGLYTPEERRVEKN